jgi:hypothetical protein
MQLFAAMGYKKLKGKHSNASRWARTSQILGRALRGNNILARLSNNSACALNAER